MDGIQVHSGKHPLLRSKRRNNRRYTGTRCNTNANIMGLMMDTYSTFAGYPVTGVVTGKPIDIGGLTPVLRFLLYLVAGQHETRYMDVIAIEPGVYDYELKEDGSFDAESTMPKIVMGYYAQNSFLEEEAEEDFWMGHNEEETEISLPFKINEQAIKLYFGSKYEFESDISDTPKSKRYNAVISGILEKTQDEMGYSSFISLNVAKNIVQQNRKLAETFGITLGEY